MVKNSSYENQYANEAADYLLGEIEKTLRAMRRLAKWAANTELTDGQRKILQKEIDRLTKEIDHIFAMLAGPPTIKH
jgi:flagellin-like hook-associated protein FlgL